MDRPPANFEVKMKYNATNRTWALYHGNQGPYTVDNFPKITVPYGHTGTITFNIVESPGVTFDPTNPLLAMPVTNPPSKPNGLDPQFKVESNSTPTALVVSDLNGVPGKPHDVYAATDYNYALKFVGARPIDPIISNSGCCKPTGPGFLQGNGMIVAGALLLIAVVAVLLLRRSQQSRNTGGKG